MSKPKFRVGQVVCKLDGTFPRLAVILAKTTLLAELSDGTSKHFDQIRPLTAREIGPRKRTKSLSIRSLR